MNLFDANINSKPRWASFENPDAKPGAGGTANNGAKGSPSKIICAGRDEILMHAESSGVIRRIWAALDKYTDPDVMKSLYIIMYWDGENAPAVEVPLADFFTFPLGVPVPFESELMSSPEGRSLCCFIPMPFYKSAKIVLSNRSASDVLFFYDVEFTLEPVEDALYFHASYNREAPVALAEPYTILEKVSGHGRYLGTSIGVEVDAAKYGKTWFGEGEIKFYIDGDTEYPTLCGTGTEDYIGDGWGQNTFAHRTQGCTVADGAKYAFYRWHTVDPIYFQRDLKVEIQVMGNGTRREAKKMQQDGVPLAVTVAAGEPVYDPSCSYVIGDGDDDDSILFFRQDTYCSVAYYYLDKP